MMYDNFLSIVERSLFDSAMHASQRDGVCAILAAWDKQPKDANSPYFLSYILATAFHETAHTMQPIAEYGHGRGHQYGVPTGPFHRVYYGRGFVQMTWRKNYVFADTHLHALRLLKPDENLEQNPELALRSDVAAAVIIQGMSEGWFTGKCLDDYIAAEDFPGDGLQDFVDARHIVNGQDRAEEIAGYAVKFLAALQKPPKDAPK